MTYDNPPTSDTLDLGGCLRKQLQGTASDPARAAAVVARAHQQGRRQVQRRRYAMSAGAVAAVVGLGVATAHLNGSVASTPIAGHGNVRTMPDRPLHPTMAPSFVVDPSVQQRADAVFAAAVAAALPEAAHGQVQVSSGSLELPLSTGQRGWTWSSELSAGSPYTAMWLDVDQLKPQPPLAVSPCNGVEQVQCSYEVLPEGGYVVSGYTQGGAELSDGQQMLTATPYARLTKANGRVIEARVMFVPVADGDSSPDGLTPQALRALVTDPRLSDVTLPIAAQLDR